MEWSELGVELEVGLRSPGSFPVLRSKLIVEAENPGREASFRSANYWMPAGPPAKDIRLGVGCEVRSS